MDTLVRIKRLVIARNVLFTQKAEGEMATESLTPELVYESILNAPSIFKTLRSRNPADQEDRATVRDQGPHVRRSRYLYQGKSPDEGRS